MNRRVAWPIVAIAALGLLLQFGVRPAAAHAFLVSADPSPGAELRELPAEIRLNFSEPLEPDSTFVLFASGFKEVAGLMPRLDPESPEQLISPAPVLASDSYTVQWTAISTLDGFETTGTYAFAIVAPSRGIGTFLPWLIPIGALMIVVIVLIARRSRSSPGE